MYHYTIKCSNNDITLHSLNKREGKLYNIGVWYTDVHSVKPSSFQDIIKLTCESSIKIHTHVVARKRVKTF